MLKVKILDIWTANNSCYGTKKVRNELLKEYAKNPNTASKTIAFHRVRRLMREIGISGIVTKKYHKPAKTDDSGLKKNLLDQNFYPLSKNKSWCSDITYIRVNGSWHYLTIIMDLFSRKVVGWNLSSSLKAEKTIIPALKMAYKARGCVSGIIIHSDQGCQYTCKSYLDTLTSMQLIASYSKKGYPYDNAPLESFNSIIKRERINRDFYYNLTQAQNTLFEYIEGFYNTKRQHSSLGNRSPEEFEKDAENSTIPLAPFRASPKRNKRNKQRN